MWQEGAKKLYQNLPATEGNAVKQFLQGNVSLTEMRRSALNLAKQDPTDGSGAQKILAEIEKAITFAELLKATDKLDFEHELDLKPELRTVGAFGMKCVLFLGGFVSDEANFGWHARKFREQAESKMAELGYTKDNPVAKAINDIKN